MTALGKRIGTDLENLAIMGDTTTADDGSANYRLLKSNEGWHKIGLEGDTQQSAGNIVDCGGNSITKTYFSQMIRSLPNQFKMNRADLRFFCSPSVIQDYRDWLTTRQTSLGDQSLVGNDPLRVFGIPIVEIPLIPENLDTAAVGSETISGGTFMWLTFPMNFVFIITRELELYWQYQPRKDLNEATLYSRVDFIVENTDAMVTGVDLIVTAIS